MIFVPEGWVEEGKYAAYTTINYMSNKWRYHSSLTYFSYEGKNNNKNKTKKTPPPKITAMPFDICSAVASMGKERIHLHLTQLIHTYYSAPPILLHRHQITVIG